MAAARNRLLLTRLRHDTREWQVKRRERTRQLIELGGLVVKSGMAELADADRAIILGALVEAVSRARGDNGEQLLLWQRRGRRAFAASALSPSE